METYLLFLGKSAFATAAFFLVFRILFQNRKQFKFNRIYLIAAMAMSYLIPLFSFSVTEYIEVSAHTMNSYAYTNASIESVASETASAFWPYSLFAIYFTGVAGFICHLIIGHYKAIQITIGSRIETLYGCRVHISKKNVHPFSFFNKIVIGERSLGSPGLQMIVEHEKLHVQEKHTIDIIVTEMLFIFQWFNPFAWLMKNAVKNNLEYQTDDRIIASHDPVDYQLAMVAQVGKEGVAPFLTALNGTQLKSRIIMMKRKQNSRYALLKQFIVLPLLAVLVMGLSEREVRTEYITSPDEVAHDKVIPAQKITISGKITNENGDPLPGAAVIIKGQPEGTITDKDGNYIITIINEDETLVFIHEGYVNQEITPGSSRQVDVSMKKADEIKIRNNVQKINDNAGIIKQEGDSASGNEPLYVVDGSVSKQITRIPPEDIESINVMKGKSATGVYGDKGANGVIEISTKSKSYTYLDDDAQNGHAQPQVQFIRPEVWPEFPGGFNAMQQFIANNIRYPERARENGIQGDVYVSFRITKEGKITDARLARGIDPSLDQEALRIVRSMPDWNPATTNGEPVDASPVTVPVKFVIKDPVVKVTSYRKSLVIPGPLYIVDGVETTSIEDLDPDNLKSISVLKSPSSTALYGQRGKDGVILISTNQPGEKRDITNDLQLRRFIADNIKYPVKARDAWLEGKVGVIFDPANSNQIIADQKQSQNNILDIDEVVVVGYGPGEEAVASPNSDMSLLVAEVERIVNRLPRIDIPGMEGKLLKLNVLFKLQSEE